MSRHFNMPPAAQAPAALSRIGTPGILFFLGILMSVSALNCDGLLAELAHWMNDVLPGQEVPGP